MTPRPTPTSVPTPDDAAPQAAETAPVRADAPDDAATQPDDATQPDAARPAAPAPAAQTEPAEDPTAPIRDSRATAARPLPPVAWFPTRWPRVLTVPSTPPPDLPHTPGALMAALVRDAGVALTFGAIVSALGYLASALVPLALGHALDAGLEHGLTSRLMPWALTLLGLAAFNGFTNWLREASELGAWAAGTIPSSRATAHRTGTNGRAVTREMAGGDVVATVTSDSDYIGAALYFVINVIGAAVSVVVVAVLMLRVSVPLGLLVLVGLPSVLVVVALLVKPLQARQAVQREEQGRLTTITTDAVAGLRVLRGIGGEDVYGARYAEQSTRVRDAGIKVASAQALLSALKTGLPGLFTAVVVGVAALRAIDGTLTVGQLVTFYGYTSFLVAPLGVAADLIQVATRSWVGARKAARIMGVPPLVTDALVPVPFGSDDGATSAGLDGPPSGTLAAASIGPTWDPAGDLVDTTTGVRLAGARTTALVCSDPAVSAVLAARLGRADDADGPVTLGGTDLRHLTVEQVRSTIIVSGSQGEVFAGTLAEAVLAADAPLAPGRDLPAIIADQVERDAVGSEAPAAGTDELGLDPAQLARVEAALAVAVGGDVLDSSGGLTGTITEKGRSLSGGQRQRLALARAVAAQAPVLVLVEPTSAVDSHTEDMVAERLMAERRGRTTVVVTASPLLLGRCDELILLAPGDGRELARGTHRELAAGCPPYAAVAHRFQGADELQGGDEVAGSPAAGRAADSLAGAPATERPAGTPATGRTAGTLATDKVPGSPGDGLGTDPAAKEDPR